MKRLIFLFAALLVFCVGLQAQSLFPLYSPANHLVTANNMPLLAWKPQPCQHYEVWIDGKQLEKVCAPLSSTVPFPLSFGKHTWYVVAVNGARRTRSAVHIFTIQDAPLAEVPPGAVLLRHNWKVQSAYLAGSDGQKLSSPGQQTKGWALTSTPTTVLSALVRNGVYPNPYIDTNNMRIPDANDEYNARYNLLRYSHIPNVNPWSRPYWFRQEFTAPASFAGKLQWLHLAEINYRAEVWLNGKRIADTAALKGMERSFQLEVTGVLKPGAKNVLAIAIYPPDHVGTPAVEPLTPLSDPGTNMADGVISRDYTKWDVMGWDWQPAVRDRDMGITEDVFLTATGALEIKDLYVTADLPLPDTTRAEVIVSALLVNHSAKTMAGELEGKLAQAAGGVTFRLPFFLQPGERKEVLLDKSVVAALHLQDPKLWWPVGYGSPHLYRLSLQAKVGGHSATAATTFGIREVETYIGAQERVYTINGRKIYCRGGNWVVDMMLNWNAQRYEEEIKLTKNANLNMLRIWGPTGVAPKPLYDAADRYGILLWQDFLNDYWGTFKNREGYQPELKLFEEATIGVVKKYRNHPSLVIWCGGNEGPNPRQDLIMNLILPKYDGRSSRHYLKQSDGDGLHGGGPYHTLEPVDYFRHPKLIGFSSEIGPSGVPVYQSILKFMPTVGSVWQPGRFPLDGVWAYHDANDWPGADTRKFSSYDNIVRQYYGAVDSNASGVEAYLQRAQLVNYDAYRSSIEAINHQLWSGASGLLLWKSNSSWPSASWQVYDWYLQAHAGYYAARRAGEPVHVQLNRHNNSITLVNTGPAPVQRVRVQAVLLDAALRPVWKEQTLVSTGPDSAVLTGLVIPAPASLQFLQLTAVSDKEQVLSTNLYWLSPSNNYTALNNLPAPKLRATVSAGGTGEQVVALRNEGLTIAFMVNLRAVGRQSGQELLPSFWSDNYVSLLPGEEKKLTVVVSNYGRLEEPAIEYKAHHSAQWQRIRPGNNGAKEKLTLR